MKQTIKPRTQLVLDVSLLTLFTILLIAIMLQLIFAHDGGRAHIVLGYIHGIAGGLMTAFVGLHLYWHLPWIMAQLKAQFRHKDKQEHLSRTRR